VEPEPETAAPAEVTVPEPETFVSEMEASTTETTTMDTATERNIFEDQATGTNGEVEIAEFEPEAIFGFSSDDMSRFKAQTGNPFIDIFKGNVPLGNLLSDGTWSILNLIMAIVAIATSLKLIVNIFRRREESIIRPTSAKRSNILKIGAVATGLLTFSLVVGLDDFSQPMTWINKWTILIGAAFAAHLILLSVYRVRKTSPDSATTAIGAAANPHSVSS
jgi:hypothetical protein